MLDDLGLWRHSGLRVLICRRYKVALSSKMAVGHLKNQHGVVVPEAGRKELQNLCTQNRVYENPHEVPLPRVGGPPVEGIAPPAAACSGVRRIDLTMMKSFQSESWMVEACETDP
ncbi:hypothetical protein EV363DRAFT_1187467 [Boletus edulis]|nr:hypothetical protein EV363DRAFT_1187467 [Boletus edulis]